jgi:hypothetical protein
VNPFVFEAEQSALPQAYNRRFVHFVEFFDPFVSRFTKVFLHRAVREDVKTSGKVMGIDLERHQTDGLETRRLNDGHVVGRLNRGARDVGPRANAQIRDSRANAISYGANDIVLVERMEQSEGVAAAYENGVGALDGLPGFGVAMDSINGVVRMKAAVLDHADVGIVIL